MSKHFNNPEELIADEDFLAWYLGTDAYKGAAWETWLLQHPQYNGMAEEGRLFLDSLALKEKEVSTQNIDQAWQRLQPGLTGARRTPLRTIWLRRLSAAAAVLLILTGAFYLITKRSARSYNNSYGHISNYSLTDGSEVVLNADSKVEVPKEFRPGNDREVWVQGEAFFKITKKPKKDRFIVHARAMDIIVTGTRFNVINREDECSVLLTEGSVTLRLRNGQLFYMKPGDFVKVKEDSVQKINNIRSENILAWQQEKLVFDNTRMIDAAKMISRYYGIKVTLADKLTEEKTVSGVMPNNNIEVLIAALEATGEFKITRKEKGELFISGT